jgi:ABC-2 type transport system ATP-binding protein
MERRAACLDRILTPVGDCPTPAVPRRLVRLRADEAARARELLEGHGDVLKVGQVEEAPTFRVTLPDGAADGGGIARTLVGEGLTLKTLREEEVNLEHVFLAITKGVTN